MTDSLNQHVLTRVRRPLALTLAGLWAERLARAFWPLWTVLLTGLAALSFGVQDAVPLEAAWIGALAWVAGAVGAGVWGLRLFRAPERVEALARLDAAMPGQPLAALADAQAIGRGDAASTAVWQIHRERMAAR
ncbi:MAG TPA: DUF4175 family protein, partial [Paracoccaceae bacterium]|nr:DUF4175 family protein [Paracoccaceae bacterium]